MRTGREDFLPPCPAQALRIPAVQFSGCQAPASKTQACLLPEEFYFSPFKTNRSRRVCFNQAEGEFWVPLGLQDLPPKSLHVPQVKATLGCIRLDHLFLDGCLPGLAAAHVSRQEEAFPDFIQIFSPHGMKRSGEHYQCLVLNSVQGFMSKALLLLSLTANKSHKSKIFLTFG